ncbi:MAG: hypothetical protein JRI62_10680 [Deltaproteobacteria bacterium]|nr:hypothetical protein [Deltaproteobacteria bacterium]MBW2741725.1 hypothetical protein [Deltaproteobacteria bacterium]
MTNTEQYKQIFESMTSDEIQEMNQKNHEEHIRQATAFREGYSKGKCYLCGKPFKTISKKKPCIHWLLKRCKFKKKKDFPKIYAKYGYHNIAAFLRWTANQERLLSNINNLKDEKPDKKIINYTIRWKNIEWTFDCSEGDLNGHPGTKHNYPHYHFQMKVSGDRFIAFNDFHVPFTDEDVFVINLKEKESDWFNQDFGSIGSGMKEAVSFDLEDILEHTDSTDDDNNATYHFSTMIDARENPITGEELYEMQQEAKRTGKSLSLIAQKRLKNRADVKTVISPAKTIPDIAKRKGRGSQKI